MSEREKRFYGSKPVEYVWDKENPLMFITYWGEQGDTLWISPIYRADDVEKYRGRWGMTKNNAVNTQNWMEIVKFKQHNGSVYAVTNIEGVKQIEEIESEIATIESQLTELHIKLQQTKQKRLQKYREVCRDFSTPVTSKDLMSMRDCAAGYGREGIAYLRASQDGDLDKQ